MRRVVSSALALCLLAASALASGATPSSKVFDLPVGVEPLFVGAAPDHFLVGYTIWKGNSSDGSMVVSVDAAGKGTPLFASPQPTSSAQCMGCFDAVVPMKTWSAFRLGYMEDSGYWSGPNYATDGTPAGTHAIPANAVPTKWLGRAFGDAMLSGSTLLSNGGTTVTTISTTPSGLTLSACGGRLYGFESKTDPIRPSASYYVGHGLSPSGVSQGELVTGKKIDSWSCVNGELALVAFDHFELVPPVPTLTKIDYSYHRASATGGPAVALAGSLDGLAGAHAINCWSTYKSGKLQLVDGATPSILKEWSTNSYVTLRPILSSGTLLYFFANIEGDIASTGLWRTDGTPAGTFPVHTGSVFIAQGVTTPSGTSFFQIWNYKTNAEEIWETDGTAAGTALATFGQLSPNSSDGALIYTEAQHLVAEGTRVWSLRRSGPASAAQFSVWRLETAPPAPPGADGGADASAPNDGGPGAPGAPGTPAGPGAGPSDASPASDASGCGCVITPTSHGAGALALLAAVVGTVIARRRRR